jgi:hypothetical protein
MDFVTAKATRCFFETKKGSSRLIVGYSDNRAKKDKYNREKGIRRLKASYKSGKITKENINRRGYNKFPPVLNIKKKYLTFAFKIFNLIHHLFV